MPSHAEHRDLAASSIASALPLVRVGLACGAALLVVMTVVEGAVVRTVVGAPLGITVVAILACLATLALSYVPRLSWAVRPALVLTAAVVSWRSTLYAVHEIADPQAELLLCQLELGMFCITIAPDVGTLLGCGAVIVGVPVSLEALGVVQGVMTVRTGAWFASTLIAMLPLAVARQQLHHGSLLFALRARRLAHEDALTGLLNRGRFRELAERHLVEDGAVSLLYLDLDHFKQVNDRFGHAEGDRVLREVAEVLRASVRGGDHVARIGGEEFAVLLPGAEVVAAGHVAERIRDAVGRADTSTATVSVGVATREPGESLEDLLRRADKALYAAKAAGRDRVCVA